MIAKSASLAGVVGLLLTAATIAVGEKDRATLRLVVA
jgi:hypothetical protein